MPEDLRVDPERLWQSLMTMAEIGATSGGGVGRLALTGDGLGNTFARRAGLENDRPPVMVGSHLDSQPLGGKFDGAYGVLAGLEVQFSQTSGRTAVTFDADRIELLRRVAGQLAISTLDLYSGAGHDACNLAQVTPSAMVFVRCARGISHNERERADAPDLAAGADLLLHAILARAGSAGSG